MWFVNIMNYVKKLLINKYFIGLVFIILIALLLTFLFNKKEETYLFLTYPDEYHLVLDNSNELTTTIMTNEKDSLYLNKQSIDKMVIYDIKTNDEFMVKPTSITATNDYIEYQGRDYYSYAITVEIPFENYPSYIMNDAFLKAIYLTGESISFKLGELWLLGDNYNKDLLITSLKGIVNPYQNTYYLGGISLKCESINSSELYINKITPLSSNISCNYDYIKEQIEPVNVNSPINEIFGSKETLTVASSKIECNIKVNKEMTILIPLTYTELKQVTNLGFIITYTINGAIYQQIIEPFTFFKPSNITKEVDLFVYKRC